MANDDLNSSTGNHSQEMPLPQAERLSVSTVPALRTKGGPVSVTEAVAELFNGSGSTSRLPKIITEPEAHEFTEAVKCHLNKQTFARARAFWVMDKDEVYKKVGCSSMAQYMREKLNLKISPKTVYNYIKMVKVKDALTGMGFEIGDDIAIDPLKVLNSLLNQPERLREVWAEAIDYPTVDGYPTACEVQLALHGCSQRWEREPGHNDELKAVDLEEGSSYDSELEEEEKDLGLDSKTDQNGYEEYADGADGNQFEEDVAKCNSDDSGRDHDEFGVDRVKTQPRSKVAGHSASSQKAMPPLSLFAPKLAQFIFRELQGNLPPEPDLERLFELTRFALGQLK
jgi:hypothetical protein